MRLQTAALRQANRAASIPKEARCILEHENGSSWYDYERAGRWYAISFWGSAGRPYSHYSYRTEERRTEAMLEFKRSIEQSVAYRTERKSKQSAWVNPLKVGDLLYTSWGYDQTNVEFFAVTKVSGRRVWIRQIASDGESVGYMQEKVWPAVPIRFLEKPETMHTAQPSGETGVYVKISESAHAWPETGKTHYSSSYA